jgi:hypothetical protein
MVLETVFKEVNSVSSGCEAVTGIAANTAIINVSKTILYNLFISTHLQVALVVRIV